MPALGGTVIPAKAIAKVVERYKKGDKAKLLAMELNVSLATIYAWIHAHRKADSEREKRPTVTAPNAAKAGKRDLALENEALRAENERLWAKVRELMLRYGEI